LVNKAPYCLRNTNYQKPNLKYKLVVFEKWDEAFNAYLTKRCDVLSTDRSGLYVYRLKAKNPKDHIILPEVISKEPLGPVVRHGDNQWTDVVRWTLYVFFEAEELGINSTNVAKFKNSKNPAVRRLLGMEGDIGKKLGVRNDWAFQIIKQVGNYEEIFERNLGLNTPLKIARGINKLWTKGGLHYSMPVK